MGAAKPTRLRVFVNGQSVSAAGLAGADVASDGTVTVDGPRLYRLVKSPQNLTGANLELQLGADISLNAFTFDSK
jgi:hypothetical protein